MGHLLLEDAEAMVTWYGLIFPYGNDFQLKMVECDSLRVVLNLTSDFRCVTYEYSLGIALLNWDIQSDSSYFIPG